MPVANVCPAIRRAAAALTMGALMVIGFEASAQSPISTFVKQTLADSDLAELAATCPDKLHESAPSGAGAQNTGFDGRCQDPERCAPLCRAGNAAVCFDLALATQAMKPDVPRMVSERLFAQACALGYPAGCTNRAASIRMVYDGDPMSALPYDETQRCAARTFAATCEADDAWGCTMHGFDLQNAVLGPEDLKAAEAAGIRACELDPADASGACGQAREYLIGVE